MNIWTVHLVCECVELFFFYRICIGKLVNCLIKLSWVQRAMCEGKHLLQLI